MLGPSLTIADVETLLTLVADHYATLNGIQGPERNGYVLADVSRLFDKLAHFRIAMMDPKDSYRPDFVRVLELYDRKNRKEPER